MGSLVKDLPSDVLVLVFQSLQDDYKSLYQCALVNRAFNRAASKFLYRRVVLVFRPTFLRMYKEANLIPTNSNLISATLPQYAPFVEIIEITGYLPTGPASRTTLSETIFSAITAFENLRVAILTPGPYFEDTFTPILKYLFSSSDTPSPSPNDDSPEVPSPRHTPPTLRELAVNFNCTCEENAPLLTKVTGLSKLSISSPTRAILDLLPDWLRRLSDSLTEFYLKDDCGSVTPGVLKSIMPLLRQNIRGLGLGLSYSLTDEDVFAFLHQLPKLEEVELRYYWQLKPPVSRPDLPHLRSFTVRHAHYQTRKDVEGLCKWIRRAISPSPIQSLRIIQDEKDEEASPNTGANVSYRSIIDHLCCRHSHTLRVLDMKSAYIDVKSLKNFFGNCKELEEVHLSAGPHALAIFKKHASSLTKLHTASFNIRNIRLSRRRVIDMELVTAIMKHGPPLLRRFSVNEQTWESTWKRAKDGTFALSIHKQPKLVMPWDREPKSPIRREPEAHAPVQGSGVLKSAMVVTEFAAAVDAVEANRGVGGGGGVSTSGFGRPRVRFSEPGEANVDVKR